MMRYVNRIKNYIQGKAWYDGLVFRKRVLLESDESYTCRQFEATLGRPPDLIKPRLFCDKITWLLLNYRPRSLSKLADKYEVRHYVAERAGQRYLIPLVAKGIYTSIDEIDWCELPDSFALKATHGCKWNIICESKDRVDRRRSLSRLSEWLRLNFYWYGREWIYRDIKPRIIAEAFLGDMHGKSPPDYKFFCFDGEPRLIQVDTDRFTNHMRGFFTPAWKRTPMLMTYPSIDHDPPPPKCLAEMLDVSRKLSAGHRFVRVDLYESNQSVYFGEMTFLPGRGIEPFENDAHNQMVGDWMTLPEPVPDHGFWSRVASIL